MQHHAADQLHIEMAHAQHALASFTNNGESLGGSVEDGPLVRQTTGIGQTLLKAAVLPRNSSSESGAISSSSSCISETIGW